MLASDHVATRVAVPAEALSPGEQDTLILLAASTEQTAKVPGFGEQRAWSLQGNVD